MRIKHRKENIALTHMFIPDMVTFEKKKVLSCITDIILIHETTRNNQYILKNNLAEMVVSIQSNAGDDFSRFPEISVP